MQAFQTILHQLADTHWLKLFGALLDPSGLSPEIKKIVGGDAKTD